MSSIRMPVTEADDATGVKMPESTRAGQTLENAAIASRSIAAAGPFPAGSARGPQTGA